MNVQTKPNLGAAQRLLPFERIALVLQGGGALGAYQAGVYEALAESRIHPDWIAGISIGGINAAGQSGVTGNGFVGALLCVASVAFCDNGPPSPLATGRDAVKNVAQEPPYSGAGLTGLTKCS